MTGLKLEHYDDVNDILLEALDTMCGVKDIYYGVEELSEDVEYVTGTINVVKLGDKPNTLKHKQSDGTWSDDIVVSESYANATYFTVEQLQNLLSSPSMRRNHYNNDFLVVND